VVFVYAIAQGIATSDPAEKLGAVLKPLRKGRQPTITDIVPLRKMILAAEEDNARPITRLGLRMLALTAVRPSELRGTEWAEFEDPRKSAIGWKTEITPSLRKAIKLRIEASGQHQKSSAQPLPRLTSCRSSVGAKSSLMSMRSGNKPRRSSPDIPSNCISASLMLITYSGYSLS
jgi:integrase